jgi:hypothetical protein
METTFAAKLPTEKAPVVERELVRDGEGGGKRRDGRSESVSGMLVMNP